MTTVAYDGRTLAADRRGSGGYGICTIRKLVRTRDGRLLGAAGDAAYFRELLEWLARSPKSRGERPEFGDDAPHVLEVCKTGLRLHECDGFLEIADEQFAIGTGSHYARAAMACGMSAADAVKLASRFDPYTGPDVDVLEWAA